MCSRSMYDRPFIRRSHIRGGMGRPSATSSSSMALGRRDPSDIRLASRRFGKLVTGPGENVRQSVAARGSVRFTSLRIGGTPASSSFSGRFSGPLTGSFQHRLLKNGSRDALPFLFISRTVTIEAGLIRENDCMKIQGFVDDRRPVRTCRNMNR